MGPKRCFAARKLRHTEHNSKLIQSKLKLERKLKLQASRAEAKAWPVTQSK